MIKFVKATDSPTEIKINKVETIRKPFVKYAEMYRNTTKSPKFDHLAYDCGVWVEQGKTREKNNYTHKSRKFPPGNSKVSTADVGDKGKDVKASACWIWRPKQNTINKGNISYLSDYEPYNGGYVSFGQGGGKITGKGIIKTEIENLKRLKVKIIRCDNGGEFRNKEMNNFCSRKGIKREFSNAKTPQQNGVAERRNKTLIEVARTMLADAKLPVTFWAEAVNTACYVQNRVLVNKSQNKTPYDLFNGITLAIGIIKPFGCHVMILNTLDNLGKFDAKRDEGYFIWISKTIEKEAGPNWLFDIDTLTNSMNYVPVVVAGTTSTNFSGTKDASSQDVKKDVSSLRYTALLNWFHEAHLESSTSNAQDACNADAFESSGNSNPTATSTNPLANHIETLTVESLIPTVSSPVPTACLDDSPEPSSDTNGLEADLGNMENNISASPAPTFIIHKDHPKSKIIGHVDTPVQTRTKSKEMEEQSFIATTRVYKVEKEMGTIDQTLFIRKHKGDFILVQVYVDDIIFGSSNPQLCREFKALMHEKFQMSAMGELIFFLGLQVLQKKDGIFLSQDKYVGDILKKFGYSNVKSAKTPMDKENP
nr:putative ribonuclease H-like domain-containing protein [Tanacetum cinerariifolium]